MIEPRLNRQAGDAHPVEDLYDAYAEVYSAIAFDRDFAVENAEIYRLGRHRASFEQNDTALLELFAGPAWHSFYWSKTYNRRVLAIDSSDSMRQLACRYSHVKPDDYLVARLPSLPAWPSDLGHAPQFSVVLALRYSIGYLNRHEMASLLNQLRSIIAPGGVFVIELHRPELLDTDFQSLAIRTRAASLGDGTTVECRWPAGPIKWTADRLVAAMPVQMIVRPPQADVTEYIEFVSKEYAYRLEHIDDLCQEAGGGFRLEDWTADVSGVFPSSVLLALRRY